NRYDDRQAMAFSRLNGMGGIDMHISSYYSRKLPSFPCMGNRILTEVNNLLTVSSALSARWCTYYDPSMRIVGIDPGLATIGLGIIDSSSSSDLHHPDWLTIVTAAGLQLHERLCEIHTDLSAFLKETQSLLVVI